MLVRLLKRQLAVRSCALRFYATSLKDYETLYDILEIDPSASKTEVRESWLKLSMQYHPDLNNDSEAAREMFMKIKDAYKVLNDDKARQAYNDKIGWRHQDPPPDFQAEWTLQGEKDRMAAKEYYSFYWDEAKIQSLMTSERLREVNWKDKAPSERYRILLEEERKQHAAEEEDFYNSTPPAKQMQTTYLLVGGCVLLLACLAYRLDIADEQYHMKVIRAKQAAVLDDVILPNGTLIRAEARKDPHLGDTEEFFQGGPSLREIRKNLKAQREAEEEKLQATSQANPS